MVLVISYGSGSACGACDACGVGAWDAAGSGDA